MAAWTRAIKLKAQVHGELGLYMVVFDLLVSKSLT